MLSFKGLATSLFGAIVDKYPELFTPVRDNLPKADIKIPYRTYVSLIFFTSLITYCLSVVALFLALRIVQVSLMMRITYLVFVPLLNSIVCFAILTFYPLQRASSRRKSIEANLPFVLTHMGAIAESGVPPYAIFRLVGKFEEYGEIAKEFRKITRNIETFGIDPLTAIREVANRTPSKEFREMLLGFCTTIESGGNIKVYLKTAGEQALFEWRTRRRRFLSQLSAYAEFYTGLLIAAPLFIIALLSVMSMLQPTIAGYSILDLTKLSIYLVVPALNTGFLLFLRGIEVEM